VRQGKIESCLIRLENCSPISAHECLTGYRTRVRHGSKFNISVAQIQPGRVQPPPGATAQLDGGEPRAPRLRVFNQQDKLIAIAEAVVPRTYQPVVVFDPLHNGRP